MAVEPIPRLYKVGIPYQDYYMMHQQQKQQPFIIPNMLSPTQYFVLSNVGDDASFAS
ncbi:hypothetical protein TanjilG_29901 [Lupinus angustifolius]|uniref:Uncharacterized protein n=1 Tax=Lupinus angustifolius TaxID=3871 RepID=A0A1J7G666_LUPAN|nr:hypothetical protein TanjilG_29901 [Lupinus angustifolius]